jgi:hypothetical protein
MNGGPTRASPPPSTLTDHPIFHICTHLFLRLTYASNAHRIRAYGHKARVVAWAAGPSQTEQRPRIAAALGGSVS